jgi:transcriptional regulator with XRE-family HTH domain
MEPWRLDLADRDIETLAAKIIRDGTARRTSNSAEIPALLGINSAGLVAEVENGGGHEAQERRRDAFHGVPSGKAFCLGLACFFTQPQRTRFIARCRKRLLEVARYLEGKTVAPERGDYYLTPDGEMAQAPGRWLADAETLERLGVQAGEPVGGADFIALMEGRHPGAGRAVEQTILYLREQVPVVRRRYSGQVVEEHAKDVIATEYRHTTARGVSGAQAPDPQMHSHIVITGAVREDERIVAVASRPLFRSARELGAFYRSALADELAREGYPIEHGTGKDDRYFEITGVPRDLCEAFSGRSREVARAAERFRARYGRAPERGELRNLALENRRAKKLTTRSDLQRVWTETGRNHGFGSDEAVRLIGSSERPAAEMAIEDLAHSTGITTSSLSKIELGQSAPAWWTVRKIADALGISLAELVAAVEAEQD